MNLSLKNLRPLALTVAVAGLLGIAQSSQAQPTTLAAAPTVPAGQVIAICNSSGTYPDITGVNDFENWGGWLAAEDYPVSGSTNVLAYLQVSYGGIGFEGNPQSVSGCTNLHMSVYTPNGDSFAIRLVDTSGHQADVIFTSASGVITDGTWLDLNFPLSRFLAATPALNLGSIQQIGLIGNDLGEDSGSDFYLDNIYFSASTNLVAPPPIPKPTNNAAIPTQPSASVVAMYNSSGTYTDVPVDDFDASWSSATETTFTITNTGNTVLKYNSLQYAGVEFYSPDQINVSGCNTMHIDLWTPNANQFGVQLVSLDNGGTQPAQVNFSPASGTIVSNQWVSLNIPLSTFSAENGSLDLSALQQLLWIDNQGGGVVGGIFYLDNVYFYSNSVAPPPIRVPTNNAPTPTRPSSGVLALYDSSGTYPESPVVDYSAPWSSASESLFTITNTGNVVLHYGGLEYAGVEFENADQINLTSYNMMHVDIWTPNANQFGIQLVSLDNTNNTTTQAGQVNVTPASGTVVSNQWVSLDIPLSQFTAAANQLDASPLDLSAVQQMLWIDNQNGGQTGGIFYIDNVYFYTVATATSPRMLASKVSGSIQLTFPTQNGFMYTVQYKTNLTDSVWQTLGAVSGNGSSQMLPDSLSHGTRFYRLSIQ